MLRQRDIVLVPVPFTDLASLKKRPAVIISSDTYNDNNEDIVVVALTSNISDRAFTLTLTSGDLESGALKVTSMVRADKIYTLNRSIVLKTVGRVKPSVFAKIRGLISDLIGQPSGSN